MITFIQEEGCDFFCFVLKNLAKFLKKLLIKKVHNNIINDNDKRGEMVGNKRANR